MSEPTISVKGPRIPETSLEVMQEIQGRLPWVEIKGEQIEALDALKAVEDAGAKASLVVMAPGTGKTIVMAADLRRKLMGEPSARAIFLNDNNDILEQSKGVFQEVVGPEFTYGTFSGDGKDYDALSVLFASFQIMRDWREAFYPHEFSFGYVDEGHHGYETTYKPTLDYFDFRHLIGVTGTPDLMDIRDIRDIFGDECYSLPIEEAIARRLLAAVDYYVYADEIAESSRIFDDWGEEYPFGQLDKKLFIPRREEEIVRIIKERGSELEKRKTIVFCKSIEHALRMAEHFENGRAYYSGMGRSEERRTLEMYRYGEIDTILPVDKLNEGVDIPDTTQVALLRGTDSKRIFIQQLARGLRKTGTKKRVQALDFVANSERLLMVDRVWNDVRKAVTGERGDIGDDDEVLEIDINTIHFNESARKILPILRDIAKRVYRPDQGGVPYGAVKVSTIANELQISRGVMGILLRRLEIEIGDFPTQRGGTIPYICLDDANRIRQAYEIMIRSQIVTK